MSSRNTLHNLVYSVVLTGGPCGGKTTGQDRLATFFESLGWKVYRVPEAATILLNGGVRFCELNDDQAFTFQESLLMTIIQLEDTYRKLAETCNRNCLIIHDRGTMDPSAYISPELWQLILQRNNLNSVEIRDCRYNQVVHLTTAADGAEKYYSLANNTARSEGIKEAIERDRITRNAWVGHPYFDVVDNQNTQTFDDKMKKLIQIICDRIGVDYGDRLEQNAVKRKYLVTHIDWSEFPKEFQQFDVVHDYLLSDDPNVQTRIRKRGQNDRWSYTSTVRRRINGSVVETKLTLTKREYEHLYTQRDHSRCTTYKKRMCFNYERTYFQLDIYQRPLPPGSPRADNLMFLETFTTRPEVQQPPFLTVDREITGLNEWSMYTMSAKPARPISQLPPIPPVPSTGSFTKSFVTNGHPPTPNGKTQD